MNVRVCMYVRERERETHKVYNTENTQANCKECRAEARMKTENREKEEMCRFNGSLESRTVRRRERERESKHRKTLFKKTLQSTYVCVQCTLYTSPFED